MSDSDTAEQSVGASDDKAEDPTVNLLIEALDSVLLVGTEGCDDFQKTYLEGLECPYNWNLSNIKISDHIIIRDVRHKLSELNDESVDFDHFKWNSFTLKLLLIHLLTNSGEYTEAFEYLDKCDKILEELEDEHCVEPLFTKIKDALWHVNIASRIYTLLKSDNGNNQTVKELLEKIPRFDEMSDVQKAGIYGIKTQMLFQYGHDGNVLALETAKKARDLDPEMAEWWFLVGKSMGRVRRVLERMECVDKEEIKTLEKAVELHDTTSYIVFLAQTYRECALRAFKKFQTQVDLKTHDLGRHIDSLNEKSLNLFMQALDKRKNCPRTMSRCAAGLLRLPGRYKRQQLAEQVVMKSLALAPENAYAHHVAGLLYYNTQNRNLKKVLEHYKKSSDIGNYGASMDLLRLRGEMNPTYDPYDDIMKFMEKYGQEVHQISLTCELGSYFLFKKRDIFKAIEFYTEVIKKDKVLLLKASFVAFLSLDGPANILKIAVDEARLVLQNTDSLTKEEKMIIRKFIIEVSRIAPELLDAEPEPGQVEKILEKSRIRMAPRTPFRNSNNGRVKMGANRTHNEQRERFQGMQERRDIRNEFRDRNESGETRNDKGYPRRRDSDQEQRTDPRSHRGNYRGRGNYNGGQRGNWRSEGNDRSETSWRSRPNDNRENHQKPHNDNRDQLKNRCWRTEGRAEVEPAKSEETYRFPVNRVPKDSS